MSTGSSDQAKNLHSATVDGALLEIEQEMRAALPWERDTVTAVTKHGFATASHGTFTADDGMWKPVQTALYVVCSGTNKLTSAEHTCWKVDRSAGTFEALEGKRLTRAEDALRFETLEEAQRACLEDENSTGVVLEQAAQATVLPVASRTKASSSASSKRPKPASSSSPAPPGSVGFERGQMGKRKASTPHDWSTVQAAALAALAREQIDEEAVSKAVNAAMQREYPTISDNLATVDFELMGQQRRQFDSDFRSTFKSPMREVRDAHRPLHLSVPPLTMWPPSQAYDAAETAIAALVAATHSSPPQKKAKKKE